MFRVKSRLLILRPPPRQWTHSECKYACVISLLKDGLYLFSVILSVSFLPVCYSITLQVDVRHWERFIRCHQTPRVYEAFVEILEVCDLWDSSRVSPVHGCRHACFPFKSFTTASWCEETFLLLLNVNFKKPLLRRSRCALSLIGCFICFGLSVHFFFVSYC